MANEVMGSISQLKIGNYYYNIRDAKVHETLSHMSDNTVSLHTLAFSNWERANTLKTNNQMKTDNNKTTTWFNDQWVLPIHINGFKIWLERQQENLHKLKFAHCKYDSGYSWNDIAITGTPTTVNQCAIIAQCRVRIKFTKQAAAAPQILKRETKGAETTNTGATTLSQTTWTHPFKIMGPTKITASHIFSGTHSVQTALHIFDRITKDTTQNDGAAYKIGINDLVLSSGASAQYTGSSVRVFLIAQGYTQENLAPEEEDTALISNIPSQDDSEGAGEDNGNENSEGTLDT